MDSNYLQVPELHVYVNKPDKTSARDRSKLD